VTLYSLFKFLHVIAVIVWIGGVVTLNVLTARLAREQNGAVLASLSRQAAFYGRAVLGPAAAITLVAGLVMVANAQISFATLWVAWGLVAILLSAVLGASLIRQANERLSRLAPTAEPGEPRVLALRRRAQTLNLINLLLLLSAVGAMVFKPTL
jgi:uncharacterized membrane protein